ncbi:MAG: flavodoxin family protein [Anaerolineales bacterium]|uniref:Flavodoxin family protein n=1 Tax=Candidatus Desulfolinea nitratireducens TaxID=2841698 RepID=A0A8J6NG69_9CHLR|nr:flavodoxin family protein [Candidatus Desulfolinea nitratireducens]MBL6960021.1 flavodoxin family protein [Anaerolineales bacterium]
MSKQILVLKSSPRENGNSNALADQLVGGAKEMGADVECLSIHDMNIQPCDACDVCQETGVCIVKDDMQKVYPLLEKADAIVLASPIYYFTINAQAKAVIDRLYALETEQGNSLGGKEIGIILTYGDTDLHNSGGINAIRTLEDTFRYIGAKIVGIVHGTADGVGDAEKDPELMKRAFNLGQKLAEA